MNWMRLSLSLFIFTIQQSLTSATAKIRCFSCLTPWNGANFDMLCKEDNYCEGIWCTKGPDERSNGILHGCTDIAPLEKSEPTCKAVNSSVGYYFNCYCNNIDFCNTSQMIYPALALVPLLIQMIYA